MKSLFRLQAIISLLAIMCVSADYSGRVVDEAGKPLAGIRVTDGFKVVLTDADGAYSLEHNPKTKNVSVVVPADRQTEKFWQAVGGEKTTGIDFRLTPRPRRKEFSFMQFSDQELMGSSLPFYRQVGDRGLSDDCAFVISTGDLCYPKGLEMTGKEMKAESFGGIRAYITLGNHDLVGEHGSGDALYESFCGPTRYAFEEGDVLFIVLPMGYGDHRPSYTYQEIVAFAKAMLDTWPKGKPVFFFNHYWHPFFDMTTKLGNVVENSFDLSPWKVIGLAYGHTHWYEANIDLPIKMWSTGQSRCGGGGNLPGAIRIYRIDKDANCTTELVESGIAKPRLTALLDSKGNLTASASGTTCKVDSVSAIINGKTTKMQRRTSWLWKLDGKCSSAEGKVGMSFRVANKPDTLEAVIQTGDKGLFRLQDTLCLPRKTFFGKPVIANGLVIIGLEDEENSVEGGVCAVDIATGNIAWRYMTGFSVRHSLVQDGAFVYGVDVRNRIFKLNIADGKEIWKNSPDKVNIEDNCHTAPCIGGDFVYGGTGTSLRAVDRETGKTMWTAKESKEVFGSTMGPVYHNGKIFIVENWGYYIKAFDAATGKLVWTSKDKEPKPGFLFQPTLTILDDGNILRCSGRYGAAIFNSENGDLLRTMDTPVPMPVSSVPITFGDMAFCGTSEAGCCAFDLKTLKLLWDMKGTMGLSILSTVQYRGPQIIMEASPVMVDGKLVCAGADGILYAVNPADGKVLDRFDVGAPLIGTPAFADGKLFVPDYSGRILVFSM